MQRRMEDEKVLLITKNNLIFQKDREIADYSPWGKSGAGAPHRNADGSIMKNVSATARKNASLTL